MWEGLQTQLGPHSEPEDASQPEALAALGYGEGSGPQGPPPSAPVLQLWPWPQVCVQGPGLLPHERAVPAHPPRLPLASSNAGPCLMVGHAEALTHVETLCSTTLLHTPQPLSRRPTDARPEGQDYLIARGGAVRASTGANLAGPLGIQVGKRPFLWSACLAILHWGTHVRTGKALWASEETWRLQMQGNPHLEKAQGR